MSLIGLLSESRGGIARSALAPPAPQTILDLLDDPALALISHWRLNEQNGAAFADRRGVADLAASGAPQRLTTALVDNDITAECIALDGIDDYLQAGNPASGDYDVTAGALGIFVQPDTSVPATQQLINRATPSINGSMSLEYLSGGQVRGWRRDGAGTLREIFSPIGAAPAGDACLLLLSWGAAGLRLYRNGVLLGENAATTNWALDASFDADLFIGRWGPGAPFNFLDGVIAQAFFLGVQPTTGQVNQLAHAASIAWAVDIDAGTVDRNQTETISLRVADTHFKSPIVPVIDEQGDLGTTSVNGQDLDYAAGSIDGFDDVVTYHFVSANGAVSQARGIVIDVIGVVQFPQTLPGYLGWFSASRSNLGSPIHGATVENLTDVADASTLFTQATLGLRGTYDNQALNVPLIRSDGTQYYTRATALAQPGLIVVCGIIDSDAGGAARAWGGARSTETPAGDPSEDAWGIRSLATATVRASIAANGGIAIADVPRALNEKVLVLMRVAAGQLTLWHNGLQSVTQTIPGARIASNGQQALLARYFNDAITAIMRGGIFSFLQYSNSQAPASERLLIDYFQDEFWPGVTPPATVTLNAGNIQQGATIDFDVIAALTAASIDTTGVDLVSVHQQPAAAGVTVSVVNGLARIQVAAGATLGATSFVYCVRRTV